MNYSVSSSHRFLAFFIDNIIISVSFGIITSFIPTYDVTYDRIFEIYKDILANPEAINDLELMQTFFSSAMFILGLTFGIMLVLYVIYLVVLPCFWSKQTVGRMIFGVKVVNVDLKKPKLSNLLLREILAGFLIYNLLSYIFLIINAVVTISNGRSIADKIGKTYLVYSRMIENEDSSNDNVIDAEFNTKEINEESNSEEEYKVF